MHIRYLEVKDSLFYMISPPFLDIPLATSYSPTQICSLSGVPSSDNNLNNNLVTPTSL